VRRASVAQIGSASYIRKRSPGVDGENVEARDGNLVRAADVSVRSPPRSAELVHARSAF